MRVEHYSVHIEPLVWTNVLELEPFCAVSMVDMSGHEKGTGMFGTNKGFLYRLD